MSLDLAINLAFLWIVGVITSYSLAGFLFIFLVLAIYAVAVSTASHETPLSHHPL